MARASKIALLFSSLINKLISFIITSSFLNPQIRARLHGEFQPVLPMSLLRGQKPHKKHLRLDEKNFSRGEVPARSRQAGIQPNRAENFSCNRVQPGRKIPTRLKVSRTCVFGMFAFITQTKTASAGSTPNLNLSQTSDKSSKQRFKWNDGDKSITC